MWQEEAEEAEEICLFNMHLRSRLENLRKNYTGWLCHAMLYKMPTFNGCN